MAVSADGLLVNYAARLSDSPENNIHKIKISVSAFLVSVWQSTCIRQLMDKVTGELHLKIRIDINNPLNLVPLCFSPNYNRLCAWKHAHQLLADFRA